jgi:hypothetical protein
LFKEFSIKINKRLLRPLFMEMIVEENSKNIKYYENHISFQEIQCGMDDNDFFDSEDIKRMLPLSFNPEDLLI